MKKGKKIYYTALALGLILAMFLISMDVFSQDRDGRMQIVDEDGGEEVPVQGTLKTKEELRLSEMLSEISGVGENQVMITYHEEDTISVFSSSDDKPQAVRGVIVAAQGASNSTVKLAITDAVTSLYGIPTSCVMVFQLKQ